MEVCATAATQRDAVDRQDAPDEKPKVAVSAQTKRPSPRAPRRLAVGKPIRPIPAFELLEFDQALRWTPGGEEYLWEPIKDERGGQRPRITVFRQRKSVPAGTYLDLVRDRKRRPELRALGLKMVAAYNQDVELPLLVSLLQCQEPVLRLEAVRTLQTSRHAKAAEILREIAESRHNNAELRAEAVLGLAAQGASDPATRQLLLKLARSKNPSLQIESLRSLRGSAGTHVDVRETLRELASSLDFVRQPLSEHDRELAEQISLALGATNTTGLSRELATALADARPSDVREWQRRLNEGGDVAAGRRVFFHSNSGGCAKCHSVNARGGRLASDLSRVGRAMGRAELVESIVEPSKAIPANYVTWTVVTTIGKSYSGLIVDEPQDAIRLATAEGLQIDIPTNAVDHRLPQKASLMPANLTDRLTVKEFRDLVAFLRSQQ